MATVAGKWFQADTRIDVLSGTPRAHAIDRWIFVFMAAWFIVIVLTGFIPDSIMKIELVRTGQRPPFPLVMHMHAVLMGSFLLLLLAQTWLMATGRRALHMQVGIAAFVLAPALVVAGFILAPTIYHQLWDALQSASPATRAKLQAAVSRSENIKLVQMRIGLLFSLFLAIGLRARKGDVGFHKRMMILATAIPLPAGIDRIEWLPNSFPGSPLSTQLYPLLAVSPMFVWDVIRNRRIHRAYWIWLCASLPFFIVENLLWDTAWWHATARQMMGVG
jgi:uncharacterized membrane protein YozB (DUF420 family)